MVETGAEGREEGTEGVEKEKGREGEDKVEGREEVVTEGWTEAGKSCQNESSLLRLPHSRPKMRRKSTSLYAAVRCATFLWNMIWIGRAVPNPED